MKVSKAAQRIATGVLAAGVVSTALVATVAAPASASVVGTGAVKLCTGSNYSAYVQFDKAAPWDGRGGMTSTVVGPNSCWRGDVGGLGHTEKIEFRGIWNTHPDQSFLVHTAYVNLSKTGIGVTVAGTTTNPTHTVW